MRSGVRAGVAAGAPVVGMRSSLSDEELRVRELSSLLEIVVGEQNATRLSRAVVAALEVGIKESWYEKSLRRKFGAN